MSQIGFGESATPNTPLHADPTATSDPHRPWANSVHESLESGDLGSTTGPANLGNENIAITDSAITNSGIALESGYGSDVGANRELLQELSACTQKCNQAYTLLQQAQEQLRLSQLVIQRQEALIASLQERIAQQESMLKESHHSCDDLRDRLKRQQHHTSQLKAALERCLENDAKQPKSVTIPHSWSITKLAEERIVPMVNEPNAPVDQIPPTMAVVESVVEESAALPIDANMALLGHPASSAITPSPHLPVESKTESGNIQTIEAPASVVKNPFPPKLSDKKLSDNSGLLPTGVPQLPTWQNPLTLHPPLASEIVTAASPSKAAPVEQHQISQMSAYPAPLAMPQVNTPKFLQHLGEMMTKDDHRSGTDERVSQGLVPRRGVSSMAAVQLPQFPPIRRH
ncbi:MAG: hypothetical protein WCO45_15435 [Pseudanabaena sp. ELA607]